MRRLMRALGLLGVALWGWAWLPACAGAEEVRFRSCAGMICLPVTLPDGNPHLLLLDTGNVNSWLKVETARALQFKLEPIEREGTALPGVYRLGSRTVSLGGRALSAKFAALGPDHTGELPPEVEGALAYTVFSGLILQIDYPRHRVRVRDPVATTSGESASPMELVRFGQGGPPVVVGNGFEVNGKSVRAQIDTCFTGTLLLYDSAIEGLGLARAAARGRPRFFPYTDGGINMNAASVECLAFGSYVLAGRPATIYFSGKGQLPVHQPDGLFESTVGNALLAHSVVTLDFHAMKMNVQRG